MQAKKFLNAIDDVKKKDTNTILGESTKGVLTGAGIGAGVGIVFGFYRKKSLLLSAFVGSLIGGGITKIFINKK
jgi:adenine/guanine phosphoribosyltransferase-like PRPP-binding protein